MSTTEAKSNKKNFRQDLTDQVVALIQDGQAPWQKPWQPDVANQILERPHNAITGRPYHGANSLWLTMKGHNLGSDDPRWCTYKQAQEHGWQVKKGSRGTTVEYWKFDKQEEIEDPKTGEKKKQTVRLESPQVFYATVFHASQIEGIPEYQPKQHGHNWDPVQEAEKIIINSGARIYHDQQDRAYYLPMMDDIHLPPREAFPQPMDYYETTLHELGHWTGHPDRLHRDIVNKFGTEEYAREELRAQMASLYLSYETGVPFNPERHAAYQGSWIKALENDKNEIFKAARDAEKIADYVLELGRDKVLEHENKVTWARYAKNGYELSSVGDKRFSALNARLKDGRSIEEAYQLDIKGYRKDGNDWRLGKGKPPLEPMTNDELYNKYLDLWKQWAKENPEIVENLRQMSAGKVLTDKFAATEISQARALADILNNNELNRKINIEKMQPKNIKLSKIPVKEIHFERSEGSFDQGEYQITTKSFKEVSNFIREQARTVASLEQDYNKCYFKVTWEDGSTYSGRYDLQKLDRFRDNHLEQQIKTELQFEAGLYRPGYYKDADWNDYVNQINPEQKAAAIKQLDHCQGLDVKTPEQTVTLPYLKRFESIENVKPKRDPNQREASPVTEYRHHAKQFLEVAVSDTMSTREVDESIAGKLLVQGYKAVDVERAIRTASPEAIRQEKTYAKEIVSKVRELPEIKQQIKDRSNDLGLAK